MEHLGELMADFFAAVSFIEGDHPHYERIGDLFIDGGKLIKNSATEPEISTVEQFITPRQAAVDAGELTSFREVETADITEEFGRIAHRLSTYEKSGVTNGTPFDGRGVISTQFVLTPQGWRMASMAWDDERPGLQIPDRYLPR